MEVVHMLTSTRLSKVVNRQRSCSNIWWWISWHRKSSKSEKRCFSISELLFQKAEGNGHKSLPEVVGSLLQNNRQCNTWISITDLWPPIIWAAIFAYLILKWPSLPLLHPPPHNTATTSFLELSHQASRVSVCNLFTILF